MKNLKIVLIFLMFILLSSCQDKSDNHTHEFVEDVKEASCQDGGYTKHYCTYCFMTYTDNYVPRLGHVFSDWIIETDATCSSIGTKVRKCNRCEYRYTKDITRKDHEYVLFEHIDGNCYQQECVVMICNNCNLLDYQYYDFKHDVSLEGICTFCNSIVPIKKAD